MPEQNQTNFFQEEVRDKLKQEIDYGLIFDSEKFRKWFKIKKELEKFLKDNPELKENDTYIYNDCLDLLNKSMWFSYPYLSSDNFIDLFRQGLSFPLSTNNYPLEDVLSIFLLNIPLLDIRDEYKKRIRENLFLNNEKITLKQIVINNKTEEPTIANWLRLYDWERGAKEKEGKGIKIVEVLFQNDNFLKLSPEEKDRVKRLCALYDELKISAMTVEGLEEWEYVVNEQGELEVHHRNTIENITRQIKRVSAETGFEEKISKELEQEKEKIKAQTPVPAPLIDINQAIENVFKKADIVLPDINLENRFKSIINSFFKDIRTGIETKITLKRDQNIGGMGFSDEVTEKVMKVLFEEKLRIEPESIKKITSETEPIVTQNLDKIIQLESQMRQEPKITKEVVVSGNKPSASIIPSAPTKSLPPQATIKIFDSQPAIAPITKPLTTSPVSKPLTKADVETKPSKPLTVVEPPAMSASPAPSEPIKIIPPLTKPPLTQPTPSSITTEIPIRRPMSITDRRPVEEIRTRPKAYGPIDEIRAITLDDWRRWGAPKEAAQKIKEKIDLLAEESLVKKAEGIKAWKESEVNKLYLDIGAESIDQGKSVIEVINQRRQQNKPILTEEEFNSVVELNQKLHF